MCPVPKQLVVLLTPSHSHVCVHGSFACLLCTAAACVCVCVCLRACVSLHCCVRMLVSPACAAPSMTICAVSVPVPVLSQVAERSLFLWNNECIVNLVAQHRHQLLPIVLPALEENTNSHWNPAVHGLTVNVRKMFQELDEPLYDKCKQEYELRRQEQQLKAEQNDRKWMLLQQIASQKAPK